MDDSSYLRLGVLAIFILLSAFASAAEAALSTISRLKIKHLREEGVRGAPLLERLLEQPQMFLATILLLNSVAIVGAAALGTLLAGELLPAPWGVPAGLAALTLVILIFAEALPKALATRHVERAALLVAGPIDLLTRLLRPIVWLISRLTNLVARGGAPGNGEASAVTEEELRLMVSEDGIIEEDEQEMIKGIFELEETTAREIMVPRIDIVAAPTKAALKEVVELIIRQGKSRIPLYEGSVDNIVGIVYVKDLLRHLADGGPPPALTAIARPAYFIPETKRVDELLHELQQKKVHIAIVVDEYGGTAGLVTIEDLLEEIVGEIQDEYDVEETRIEQVSENEALLDSRVGVDALTELFGVTLETEDVDTVGGFVYNQLGKIPTAGDEVQVDGLKIAVVATAGRRIKKVRVTRVPAA
ncbi:MAG: HlyC/CorC family transporter [Chloroflexi bacterium]|nr:HlyC/CorC family transporter [Chloroflexota bacterium]